MKPIGMAILGTSYRSTMLVNYLKRNPDQGFLTGLYDQYPARCDIFREEIDLRERMNSGHGGADDNILTDFFRCCRTGDKPRSSWTDGRASVALGLAVRESCDTGQPVEVKD